MHRRGRGCCGNQTALSQRRRRSAQNRRPHAACNNAKARPRLVRGTLFAVLTSAAESPEPEGPRWRFFDLEPYLYRWEAREHSPRGPNPALTAATPGSLGRSDCCCWPCRLGRQLFPHGCCGRASHCRHGGHILARLGNRAEDGVHPGAADVRDCTGRGCDLGLRAQVSAVATGFVQTGRVRAHVPSASVALSVCAPAGPSHFLQRTAGWLGVC